MNGTTTQAPTVTGTTSIRNVVLVGPSGSGKSRLFDHVVDAVVPGARPRGQTEPTTGLRAATLSRAGRWWSPSSTPRATPTSSGRCGQG